MKSPVTYLSPSPGTLFFFTLRQERIESDGAHVGCPDGDHGEVAKPPVSLQHPPLIELKQSLKRTIIIKYYFTKL